MNQLELLDRILVKRDATNKHITTNFLRSIVFILIAVFQYTNKMRRTSWNAAKVLGLELFVITVPLVILIALWVE